MVEVDARVEDAHGDAAAIPAWMLLDELRRARIARGMWALLRGVFMPGTGCGVGSTAPSGRGSGSGRTASTLIAWIPASLEADSAFRTGMITRR